MEKKIAELRRERHDFETSERYGWRDLGTLAMHCNATSLGRAGMREGEESRSEAEDIRVGFRLRCWVGGRGRRMS